MMIPMSRDIVGALFFFALVAFASTARRTLRPAHRKRRQRRVRSRLRHRHRTLASTGSSVRLLPTSKHVRFTQQMVDRCSASASSGSRNSRRRSTSPASSRRTASRSSAASPAFRPRGSRRWGSGKPVIALGSDIDGIPQASQKPGVAYHDPIIEGAPGHGEGHNSGVPLQHHGGARGEEDHGARAPAGHARSSGRASPRSCSAPRRTSSAPASSRTSTSRSSRTSAQLRHVAGAMSAGTALVSVEYTFKGESAHAAGARGAAGPRSTPSS